MSRRYIRHSNRPPNDDELEKIRHDILATLVQYMNRIHKHIGADSASDGKVYVGVAGGVIMNQHLLLTALSFGHLLPVSDTYLTKALSLSGLRDAPRSPSRASFLETTVGISTLVLLRVISGETSSNVRFANSWPSCVQLLNNTSQAAIRDDQDVKADSSDTDGGGCEVLYGRAGFLYALLRLRKSFPTDSSHPPSCPVATAIQELVSDAAIQAHVDRIIQRGRTGSKAYATEIRSDDHRDIPALMWTWHGKRYIGAAHGVAGILQILLSCPWEAVAPHISLILNTVEWLAALQDSSGNWPAKAPSHPRSKRPQQENDLVQWCHGAPGILILFSTVIRQSPIDPRTVDTSSLTTPIPLPTTLHQTLLTSLHRGASLVYRHGFLRKGTGLCHGVAGSVYALLAVSDAFAHQPQGDSHHARKNFLRAVHLAHLASESGPRGLRDEMVVPDRPWSLYEGVAGMCCAWGEVVARLNTEEGGEGRGFPGFADL